MKKRTVNAASDFLGSGEKEDLWSHMTLKIFLVLIETKIVRTGKYTLLIAKMEE